MPTPLELLQKRREEASGELDALVSLTDATEEQGSRADELIEEIRGIDKKFERMLAAQELEERANETVPTAAGEAAIADSGDESRGGTRVEMGDDHRTEKPWETLGHQLQAVREVSEGTVDPRLLPEHRAASGANESIPSDAGFLVSKDFSPELLKKAHDTGKLQSLARRMPISGNSNGTKVNGIDETSRKNGSRWGGIVTYWADEAELMTKSKPKFRQISLDLNKLTALFYATDEALRDAAQLTATINEAFPEEFGFKIDDVIMWGDGVGKPLGRLVSDGHITVGKEDGQTEDTIVAENIFNMYSRMWGPSLARARWEINQDCWPQIFQLHQVVGTGGVPLFIPAGGINQAPNGTLLGKPIEVLEHCETIGTKGDIQFVDPTQYIYADKDGIKSDASIHVRFLYNETAFRFTYRIDGQPIWNKPLTPYKGTVTQAPSVALESRD